MELNQLRQQIDKIDIELLKLFAKRFEIVKRVGEWKKQNWVKKSSWSKKMERAFAKKCFGSGRTMTFF